MASAKKENIGFIPSVVIGRQHLILAAFAIFCAICASLLILPTPFNLIPFIIVFGIIFLFLSIRYPMIGIFIYMIIFFVRPQELFPHVAIFSYPYEKIVAIIVIANLVLDYAINGKKIKLFAMDKAMLGILLVTFVSIGTSIWISWAWTNFERFYKTLLVYFFMSRLLDTDRKFDWIIWLYIISSGFIAASSTINYYQGHYQTTMGIQRAVGLGEGAYGDPNSMATTLVLAMPFVFYVAKAYKNRLLKLLLMGVLATLIWTVIITGSRGGMLGAAFAVMVIAWHSRQKVIATVAAAMVILLALAVMPEQYSQRLTTILNYDDTSDESGAAESAQGRIKGIKVGFEILMKRPLAGVGIGCFSIYNHQYHGSSLNPHNLLGQLMGDLGFLGLAAFAFMTYMMAKHVKYIKARYEEKNWPKDVNYHVAQSVKVSLYSLYFLGLFGHNAYRFNWYIFACFLAIAANLVDKRLQAVNIQTDTEPRVLTTNMSPETSG